MVKKLTSGQSQGAFYMEQDLPGVENLGDLNLQMNNLEIARSQMLIGVGDVSPRLAPITPALALPLFPIDQGMRKKN